MRATWTLTWNDSHLYVLADVTDPVLTQTHSGNPSQLAQGDGISFEFGTVTPQNANRALEAGDLQVLLGPSSGADRLLSAVNVASGVGFTPGTSSIAGLEGAVRANDRGYLIEAAIPWSTLGQDGEARLAEQAVSVRCLVAEDGSVPEADDAAGTVAIVARAY